MRQRAPHSLSRLEGGERAEASLGSSLVGRQGCCSSSRPRRHCQTQTRTPSCLSTRTDLVRASGSATFIA
eukprot:2943960-Rhodomonas_salina.1